MGPYIEALQRSSGVEHAPFHDEGIALNEEHLQDLLVQGYPLVEERGFCIDQKKSYGPTKSSPKGRRRASMDGANQLFGVSAVFHGFQ